MKRSDRISGRQHDRGRWRQQNSPRVVVDRRVGNPLVSVRPIRFLLPIARALHLVYEFLRFKSITQLLIFLTHPIFKQYENLRHINRSNGI